VDLNSTNGTLVNGETVISETVLNPDDEIEVGTTRISLVEVDTLEDVSLSEGARAWSEKASDSYGVQCEECGRELVQEELLRGAARHVGDRYYCSDCSASFEEGTSADDAQLQPVTASTAKRLEPGDEIASVRTISLIGEGSLGPLYKGEQTSMGRLVALKVLDVTDREWVQNYLKAVYASGQLVHPNIVLIFDAGELDGCFYVIREYVEGQSIEQRLASRKPVPLDEAFKIVVEVAYSLEYAFERHVFHGGLSPRRILLGARDSVKVTGFGLPRTLPPNHPVSAHAWRMLSYRAPELVRGAGTPDFAGDVYSLVAVFYHLLTGRPPFSGSTQEKLKRRIVNRVPRPLSQFNADLPPVVQRLIDRGLSKDPRARYQLPREFLYDLEENLRREI